MAESGVAGGGIHPGKPIIWPTGKSTPVTSSPTTETTGNLKSAPTSPSTPTAPTAPTAAPTAPKAPPTAARAGEQVARPLTVEDLRSHLLSVQVQDTDFNVKLASLMLRNGVELSRSNFVKVLTALDGTDKSMNMQEAALVSIMKGIDSPAAVKALGNFFAQNPQLASQLLALQGSLGDLRTALSIGKAMLDPGLVANLTALLTQFDDEVKKLPQKYRFAGDNSTSPKDLMNNVRAMKSLLQGMQQAHPMQNSAESQVMNTNLQNTINRLSALMENMTSQAVLSQPGREEVNYLYQQIPNVLGEAAKNIDIVIKREGKGEQSIINPNNTQVVLSLETENMGKIVVTMIVKDKRVYLVMIFSEKNYGDDARKQIPAEYAELQKKLSTKEYVLTGYQVKVDPAMCSVKSYLIPLLPKLEDLLKKIDVEA
ncbi:MAG: hypothetical protein NT099_05930 [Candidatus Saganbacteria bacterium]|nr:hypothetical protein [Candidatus Saganbacteria bacterium]